MARSLRIGLAVAMVWTPVGSILSCSNQAERCEETRTCTAPSAGVTSTSGGATGGGFRGSNHGGDLPLAYSSAGTAGDSRDSRGTAGSVEAGTSGQSGSAELSAGTSAVTGGASFGAAGSAGVGAESNFDASTAGVVGVAGRTSLPCNGSCIRELPYCEESTNVCAECLTDTQCPPALPACESTAHRCVGCTDVSHCSGDTPACDVKRNICVACTSGADCDAAKPACNMSNVCVECVSNANCKNPAKPVCLATTQTCVACATSADCTGNIGKTVCKPAVNACVDCLSSADCKDATKHVCETSRNACVECLSSPDCAGKPATPVCNPSSNSCVGCLTSADCKDAKLQWCNTATSSCVACLGNADCKSATASRCEASTNTCQACSADSDCTQIAGKNICLFGTNGQPNACAQCTGKRYAACGKLAGKDLVCNSAAHVCTTDRTIQSAGLCQACVSDVECTAGKLCYSEQFNGSPDGNFCMWKQGDSANGAPTVCYSTQARPFVKVEADATSIDGEKATLCTLRSTTCTAYNQFSSVDCAPSGSPKDANCGVAAGIDSKCVETSSGSGIYRCSTVCGSNDDCKTGFACSTGVSPNVCKFQ